MGFYLYECDPLLSTLIHSSLLINGYCVDRMREMYLNGIVCHSLKKKNLSNIYEYIYIFFLYIWTVTLY